MGTNANSVFLLQNLSPAFTDSDKQILIQAFGGNCTTPMTQDGPTTLNGPTTINNLTSVNNVSTTTGPTSYGLTLQLAQLTADLQQGLDTTATLGVWAPSSATWLPTGANVTIWDSPRFGPAATGQWAVINQSPKSGRNEIVGLISEGTGTAAGLLFFQLTSSLSQGGTATATILHWTGSAWSTSGGASVTVDDVSNFGPANPGAQGACQLNQVSGLYDIVSLKVPPQPPQNLLYFVQFTAPLTQGSNAAATVAVWSGSAWVVSGPSVTVYDVPLFGPAFVGDYAVVQADPISGFFEIVALMPGPREMLVKLAHDLPIANTTTGTGLVWDSGTSSWTTTGGPTGVNVYDQSFKLGPALQNDLVLTSFAGPSNRWEIINMPATRVRLVKLTADCGPGAQVNTTNIWTGTAGSESSSGVSQKAWNWGPGYLFSGEQGFIGNINGDWYMLDPRGLSHWAQLNSTGPTQGTTCTVTIFKSGSATSFTSVTAICRTTDLSMLSSGDWVFIVWDGVEWAIVSAQCP